MASVSESIINKLKVLERNNLLIPLDPEEGDVGVEYFGLSESYENNKVVVDGVRYNVDFVLALYDNKSAQLYIKLRVNTSMLGEIVREFSLAIINGWVGVESVLDQKATGSLSKEHIPERYDKDNIPTIKLEYDKPMFEIEGGGEVNNEITMILKDVDDILAEIANTGLRV